MKKITVVSTYNDGLFGAVQVDSRDSICGTFVGRDVERTEGTTEEGAQHARLAGLALPNDKHAKHIVFLRTMAAK